MTYFVCDCCGFTCDLDKLIILERDGVKYNICENCNAYADEHIIMMIEERREKAGLPSENTCVCCGEVIPEGRHVCLKCQKEARERGLREQARLDEFPEYNHPTVHTVYERDSNPVDIHKIIDDAMEKRDRTVSIYIGEAGVSVNVYPADQDKVQWIETKHGMICSNCGNRESSWDCPTYCSRCGELMHGVRKEKHDE